MKADIIKKVTVHLHLTEDEFLILLELVRFGYKVLPSANEEQRDMAQWIEQIGEDL